MSDATQRGWEGRLAGGDAATAGRAQGTSGGARGAASDEPWVGASFADRASAERAYQSLIDRGYDKDEIGLVMSDEARRRFFPDEGGGTEFGEKVRESGESAAAQGSLTGAVIGTLLALGSNFVLPGIGLFVAGPLLVGLGAAAGGLAGALAASGIPEDEAERYASDIKNGRIVLGVRPHSDEDSRYFAREWKSY